MWNILRALFVVSFLFGLSPSFGAEPTTQSPPTVTLESIDGAKTISISSSKVSESREIAKGDPIAAGSRVRIAPNVTATLLYSNGSRLVLSGQADFELEEYSGDLQMNHLHAGKVRGTVTPVAEAQPKRKIIHFILRTKSVVMGVRGTVFDMEFKSAGEVSRVETIEGTVEVAKDQTTLLTHGGLEIPAGHFITATFAGISALQESAAAVASVATTTPVPPSAIVGGAELAPPLFGMAGLREWLPTPHLFFFDVGALVSADPRLISGAEGSTKISPFISWKPGFGLPKVDFIRARFHLGFAKRENFFIRDIGMFFTAHAWDIAFAEFGFGDETWMSDQGVKGSTFDVNFGLILGASTSFDRVFVGRSSFRAAQATINQWRVGLGFSF